MRQWCQAATKASRTARARRREVAGERVGLQQQAVAGVLVERVEASSGSSWRGPRYGSAEGARQLGVGAAGSGRRGAGDDGRAMTSLLPRSTAAPTRAPATPRATPAYRAPAGPARRAGRRRPRPPRRSLVCLAVGVVGWFLTDAGAHGTPRDGLRVGALAWLMAHGSGRHGPGRRGHRGAARADAALAAWATWRVGHRVGDSVSGHGPDADAHRRRRAGLDRPRRAARASPPATSRSRVVTAALAAGTGPPPHPRCRASCCGRSCCALRSAAPAIAIGSGRAAIWAAYLPATVGAATGRTAWRRPAAPSCWRLVAGRSWSRWSLDLGAAANVLSQLHTDAGDATLLLACSAPPWCRTPSRSPAPTCSAPASRSAPAPVVSPTVVVARAAADVPAAGRAARRRPDAGVDVRAAGGARRWSPRSPRPARQRRYPTLRWDEGAAARLRRRRARRRAVRRCSPRSPAAPSAPAGCSRRRPVRRSTCWCTRSPPSASAACSAGCCHWRQRRHAP